MCGGERERTRKWLVTIVEVGKEEVWRALLVQISVAGGEAVGEGVCRAGGVSGLGEAWDAVVENKDERREANE